MLTTISSRLKHQFYGSRLHARIVRGGVWLGTASLTAQAIRFGRNIVLVRVLAPESFGIMAIVLSISSMMDAFTEIGMKEALIQNQRGQERGYVNSAWWLGFARSLIIYALVFALAPKVAAYYALPSLSPLIRVALFALVFTGAISPQAFVALKQLNYKRWAVIQYGSSIAGTLLTVGLALLFRSVWGLALGFVAESASRCILSYALCPFRPSFRIQTDAARDLLRFSRGIFGLSFLNFIFSRSDVFVLGKMISSAQLGIYTIGIYLAQVPASFALEWLAQIFMPLFSRFNSPWLKS
jgi:lipopolysaccharide exporter